MNLVRLVQIGYFEIDFILVQISCKKCDSAKFIKPEYYSLGQISCILV